jgi:hypothetical protein
MFTEAALDTEGKWLRFRMVGLLTCRLPYPRCLLSTRAVRLVGVSLRAINPANGILQFEEHQ